MLLRQLVRLGDCFRSGSDRRTQLTDIPNGWLAKQAAVLTIELTGAFVPDLKSDGRGVHIISEHAGSRSLQANLLLVLQRTHRRERPEMMMQRRHGHACYICKFFNAKRLAVVSLNPGDCFGGAVTRITQRRDGAQPCALRPAQDSIHDLALDQGAQERNVPRVREQVEHTTPRAEKIGCDGNGGQGRTIRGRLKPVELLAAEELTDNRDIKFE